ncbi:hypothetical protein CU098_009102, partial [Rhizopus stolonifer]
MPPIVLKIQSNDSLPFSDLDQDELSKTWRVCTKVKDALENGSRLENLSWRLWFIQNVLNANDAKFRSTKKMETEPVSIKNDDMIMLEQQSVLDTTENFILNQFTSDQEGNQMIELKDIFPFGMQEEAIVSQPCYTHYAYQEPYNNFDSSVPVYDTPSDPIVGIQSLFNADASTMPSMSIPSDDHNMTQLQEQNM